MIFTRVYIHNNIHQIYSQGSKTQFLRSLNSRYISSHENKKALSPFYHEKYL